MLLVKPVQSSFIVVVVVVAVDEVEFLGNELGGFGIGGETELTDFVMEED